MNTSGCSIIGEATEIHHTEEETGGVNDDEGEHDMAAEDGIDSDDEDCDSEEELGEVIDLTQNSVKEKEAAPGTRVIFDRQRTPTPAGAVAHRRAAGDEDAEPIPHIV